MTNKHIPNHNPSDCSSNNPAVLCEDFNDARKRFATNTQGSDMLRLFIPINYKSQTHSHLYDSEAITED